MKYAALTFFAILFFGCQSISDNDILEEPQTTPTNFSPASDFDSTKVQVLNIGTFHMDYTSDGHSEEYDQNDQENRKQCIELAQKIAEFKPTVILIETLPKNNKAMQEKYLNFKNSDELFCDFMGEIGLVAFAVGKMCNVDRIFGIDHKIYYNFQIGEQMIEEFPSKTYNDYRVYAQNKFRSDDFENQHLIEKIYNRNTREYYDFMLNMNADILTYVSSDSLFEGADEAAEFYKRNLRMFSNMNKIELEANDRVFVFMGAAHTAFFDNFMSRSPKYQSVNALDYLSWK